MISFKGKEELDLRRLQSCLEHRVPLASLTRQAVKEFVAARLKDPKVQKRWQDSRWKDQQLRLIK